METMLKRIRNSRFLQYYAAIAATCSITAAHCYGAWSSPVLPQLFSDDSPIGQTLSKEQGSWVASIHILTSLPTTLAAGWISNMIGRKGALLFTFIPIFFPWIIIIFAKSFWALIIAKVIASIGGGLIFPVCAMYNGEIADPDIRGNILNIFNLMKLLGDLLVLTTGPYVSYTALAIICSSIAVLFLLMFFWVPESPYYLVQKGRMEEARAALVRFNSANANSTTIDKKLADIQQNIQRTIDQKTTLWAFLSNKEYHRVLFIMWGVKTLQTLSGGVAMDSYLQTIIESTGSSISPQLSSIIFGVVQLPAILASMYLVDRIGRKPLFIASAIIAAVALIAEGVYFFLQDYIESDVGSISWLPTTALTVFIIIKSVGLQTLPYVLLGEIFPTNIKGSAVSVSVVYGNALAFLSVKLFDPLSGAWGRYTMLWFFSGMCILGALFIVKFLPETKGKTFDEIQQKIHKK